MACTSQDGQIRSSHRVQATPPSLDPLAGSSSPLVLGLRSPSTCRHDHPSLWLTDPPWLPRTCVLRVERLEGRWGRYVRCVRLELRTLSPLERRYQVGFLPLEFSHFLIVYVHEVGEGGLWYSNRCVSHCKQVTTACIMYQSHRLSTVITSSSRFLHSTSSCSWRWG